MPIHVWRFGDQFSMVFLGGEVVADYALRIRRELPAATWISSYCDDVFGYVASERMRDEGGYEVDESMIYYNQPGRWSTGTEEVVLRRIHELYNNQSIDRPRSVEEALQTFSLPDGYEIEVVACEPSTRSTSVSLPMASCGSSRCETTRAAWMGMANPADEFVC